MKKISPKFLVFLVVCVLVAWFFRPFFHPLVMSFVISPLSLLALIIFAVALWYIIRSIMPLRIVQTGMGKYSLKTTKHVAGGRIALLIVAFLVIVVGLFLENEIKLWLTAKQVTYDVRTTLPEFTPARLTPKDVATRYAEDSFQNPQEHLGDSQIVLDNGHLRRVFPRLPEGPILYFTGKLTGFVTVDVDTLSRKVDIVDQKFDIADHIGLFDNLYYKLEQKKYFVTYSSEPVYLKDDTGKWVTVVPYMTYKGVLFRTPQWGGVMVVDSNGSITDYTPEQAQNVSYLQGNRIYPKELTEFYTASYAYRGGLLNKWFVHKNETQVVHLPNGEEVLHLPSKEGYKQMVVAEPYGRSYGIYRIFLIDATTGKSEVIEYDQKTQLTGPIAATDYIKKEFPTYDWNSFTLAEPRPAIINGDLNWLLSIIPSDSAGIAGTVLLDAHTNTVTKVDSEDGLKQVLAGQKPTTTTPSNSTDPKADIKAKIDAIEQQLQELKKLVQ